MRTTVTKKENKTLKGKVAKYHVGTFLTTLKRKKFILSSFHFRIRSILIWIYMNNSSSPRRIQPNSSSSKTALYSLGDLPRPNHRSSTPSPFTPTNPNSAKRSLNGMIFIRKKIENNSKSLLWECRAYKGSSIRAIKPSGEYWTPFQYLNRMNSKFCRFTMSTRAISLLYSPQAIFWSLQICFRMDTKQRTSPTILWNRSKAILQSLQCSIDRNHYLVWFQARIIKSMCMKRILAIIYSARSKQRISLSHMTAIPLLKHMLWYRKGFSKSILTMNAARGLSRLKDRF